jgi:hypothetical protein
MKGLVIAGVLAVTVVSAQAGAACCGTPEKATAVVAVEVKPQTKCPVMGGAINKSLYVDVKGFRVYVCCQGCVAAVQKDPEKYIAKIKENGETPETLKTEAAKPPAESK